MTASLRKLTFLVTLLILLLAPAAVMAGDHGDLPSPGDSGGHVGGPGMGGSAQNAGRDSGSAPTINFEANSGNAGGNLNGNAGGNLGGNATIDLSGGQTGGSRRGQTGGAVMTPSGDLNGDGQTDAGTFGGRRGGQGQAGSGNLDGDGQPDTVGSALGGFAPFSGQDTTATGRFGGRGSGTLFLESAGVDTTGGWRSQLSRGGFGSFSEGGTGGGQSSLDGTPWHPLTGESGVPAAPAALGDLTDLQQTQAEAQAAVNQALSEASDSAHAVADEATDAAQETYDQFWEDYYDAVDYTADAYYDTVTATTDYMLQTYEEAVDYTAQTVDYYIDYAAQYASYCALYPWDCYSYAYSAATGSYVYVGEVSVAPVTTVNIGAVEVDAAVPVEAIPAPSAEAYQAIVIFANDQLGAVVDPLYAGVATESVQQIIAELPAQMQAFYTNATSISGAAYWGLLHGGVAAVAVGDCSTGNCAVSADNLDVQLSSSSAGLYGILSSAAMPASASDALRLITQVYPALNGLQFAQVADVSTGMAFTATSAGLGIDPATGKPVSAAKVVYAGVVESDGHPLVYALVAVGEGYVNILSGG